MSSTKFCGKLTNADYVIINNLETTVPDITKVILLVHQTKGFNTTYLCALNKTSQQLRKNSTYSIPYNH